MAAYTELDVEKYATFSATLIAKNSIGETINVSGYTANSSIRKSYYSTTSNNFTATVTGNSNGEITLSMTAANTALLSPGRYYYDVLITSGEGTKTRIAEGIVNVLPGVTQS